MFQALLAKTSIVLISLAFFLPVKDLNRYTRNVALFFEESYLFIEENMLEVWYTIDRELYRVIPFEDYEDEGC